jgi:D-alanyl-D-alanine carboxypeptidase
MSWERRSLPHAPDGVYIWRCGSPWSAQPVRWEGSSVHRFGIGLRLAAIVTMAVAVGCTTSHESPELGPRASPAASRFPDPVTSPLPPAKVAALQKVLNQAVADYTQFPGTLQPVPGVTAALLSDHGSWTGAAGKGGDGAQLSPQAMMAIYSVTKTFTAAEVMHLAATGRVDLDAPLSKYVQHRLTGNGATVRQALGMRSGLPGFTDQESQALLSAGLAHPGRHWTMQESLAYLKGNPSPPGGDPVYSSANYWLLGLLVENVTGRSLAEAYRADLLDPAGLNRIAVQDTERPTPPLAAPPRRLHLPPPDGYLPYRSIASGTGPAGGIAADAQTVARWGYQLYGARLLPAETVQAMMTPPSQTNIFPGARYGLGTMLFATLGAEDAFGHSGNDVGYSSLLAVLPARHLSIAVLVPDENNDVAAIVRDLLAVLR